MRAVAGWIVLALGAQGCSSSGSSAPGADAAAAEGGGSDAPGARVPVHHRATTESCPTALLPEDCPGGCGACSSGKNGRCMHDTHICICVYDECFGGDCGDKQSCDCRSTVPSAHGSNVCVDSACLLDADCGPGGYCSPTFDLACGARDGVAGWHCHTPKDSCLDDGDCTAGGKTGYCAFFPAQARWACSYAVCI